MFYLVMAILTALTVTVGFAHFIPQNKTIEGIEYAAMAVCAILCGMLWPLTLVVLVLGGVFWIARDLRKQSEVQITGEE